MYFFNCYVLWFIIWHNSVQEYTKVLEAIIAVLKNSVDFTIRVIPESIFTHRNSPTYCPFKVWRTSDTLVMWSKDAWWLVSILLTGWYGLRCHQTSCSKQLCDFVAFSSVLTEIWPTLLEYKASKTWMHVWKDRIYHGWPRERSTSRKIARILLFFSCWRWTA